MMILLTVMFKWSVVNTNLPFLLLFIPFKENCVINQIVV